MCAVSDRPPQEDHPAEELHALLTGLTRRALLTIYSREQVRAWLQAHASGDPVAVARKALRLCGDDPVSPARGERSGSSRGDHRPHRAEGSRMSGSSRPPGEPDLARITRALAEPRDLDAFLQRIVELATVAIAPADHVGLSLGGHRQIGTSVPMDRVARILDQLHETTGEGPCLDALRGPLVVETEDLRSESRWPLFTDRARRLTDIRSVLAVPLAIDGQALGVLNVYATAAAAFSDEDRSTAAIFAVHAAVALQARQTEAELLEALETRDLIGQATGILMAGQHLDRSEVLESLHAACERTGEQLRRTGARRAASSPPPAVGRGPSGSEETEELSDLQVQEIMTEAVREMYACERSEEVVALLLATATRLGASIVKPDDADENVIPANLTLGEGEPLLAMPDPSLAHSARHLQIHLPRLVEDAHQVLARLRRNERSTEDAEIDPLTGSFKPSEGHAP